VSFVFFFLFFRPPPLSTLFPYTTLFRSRKRVSGFIHQIVFIAIGAFAAATAAEFTVLRAFVAASTVSAAPSATTALAPPLAAARSEEHTSELQSRGHLVCRLLLEKKKKH